MRMAHLYDQLVLRPLQVHAVRKASSLSGVVTAWTMKLYQLSPDSIAQKPLVVFGPPSVYAVPKGTRNRLPNVAFIY